MVLSAHILIALAGLGFATFMLFRPSQKGFYVSYCLLGGTVISGTYLVLSTGSHLIEACLMGLFYLGITFALLSRAQHKLKNILIKNK